MLCKFSYLEIFYKFLKVKSFFFISIGFSINCVNCSFHDKNKVLFLTFFKINLSIEKMFHQTETS